MNKIITKLRQFDKLTVYLSALLLLLVLVMATVALSPSYPHPWQGHTVRFHQCIYYSV